MAATVMQNEQLTHKWSHTNLIDPHDERYKPYICPRHPPNSKGHPSRPYVFPTELLSFMLLDIRSEYLSYLFLTEAWDDEEIEERLAVNPFPAFLRVSHQFREIAFNVIQNAFGARRDADGCLAKGAWGCLRYIMKYVHLVRRGAAELVEAHVKTGEAYIVPPTLSIYVQFARLTCCGSNQLLLDAVKELGRDLEREIERREVKGYKRTGTIQPVLSQYAFAVTSCLRFRLWMTSFLPILHLWTPLEDKDAPDIILRTCYGTWYMMSDLGSRLTTGKHMMPDPFENSEPLVEVPILLPRGVNADLLVRCKLLAVLWKYRNLSIVANDEGLQNMSQQLLDACVDISMPRRKSPIQQGTRQRRVSFTEFDRVKAVPRPSFLSPCLCEERLRIV